MLSADPTQPHYWYQFHKGQIVFSLKYNDDNILQAMKWDSERKISISCLTAVCQKYGKKIQVDAQVEASSKSYLLRVTFQAMD